MPPKSVHSVSLGGVPPNPDVLTAPKSSGKAIPPPEVEVATVVPPESGGGGGCDTRGQVLEQEGKETNFDGGRELAVSPVGCKNRGHGPGTDADVFLLLLQPGKTAEVVDSYPCCSIALVFGNNVGFLAGKNLGLAARMATTGAVGINVTAHWMFTIASPCCAAAAATFFFGWQALGKTRPYGRCEDSEGHPGLKEDSICCCCIV